MGKCQHNRNTLRIETSLVDSGIDDDVTSIFSATLVSTKDGDQGSSASNCYTIDLDIMHRYIPLRTANMEEEISYEAEETGS